MKINSDAIVANFNKTYSMDREGDNYPRGLFSGLTLGVVVDTDDPLQGGRLRIFCPALNDNPKKPQHLPWATYVSPFSGTINNAQFYRGADPEQATSKGSMHYGFWAIPEQGAHVLVGCIDGDPRRRFWIGCIPEHQETNTIHHGRWKWKNGNVDGPLSGNNFPVQPLYDNMQEAFDGRSDSPEWRSRVAEYQTAANSADVGQIPNSKMRESLDQQNQQIKANDPDTWEHAALGAHGYDWSGFKKIPFMASRVFGISTPGMHAFTMDDRPFNSRIRLRTTAGHQILMDDTNERIYVATNDGNNYIEMDSNGNIDCYSKNRISFHAENDINFQTDKSFRVLAKEGIFMYAGVPEEGSQQVLDTTPEPGEIRIHSSNDMHLLTEANMRQYSFMDTYREAAGDINDFGSGNIKTYAGSNIDVSNGNGSMTVSIQGNINETAAQNSKRFSYGSSSIASGLENEIVSFESSANVSGLTDVNVKAVTGNVNMEAMGASTGMGSVNMKSPNSQVSVSEEGMEILSDKSINVKAEDRVSVEVRADGPSLSGIPAIIYNIPEIPFCDCGLLPDITPDCIENNTLTALQAATVAFNAGFRGKDLITAVALMAASEFATNVLYDSAPEERVWSQVVGPFKIRTLKNPENYCGLDRERDNRYGQLEDVNANARLAFKIFNEEFPPGRWAASKWNEFEGEALAIMANVAMAIDAVANLCNVSPSSFVFPPPLPPVLTSNNTVLDMTQTQMTLQAPTDIRFKSGGSGGSKSYNNMIDVIDESVDDIRKLGICADCTVVAQNLTPASISMQLKTIEVVEIPPFDDITGKIYNAQASNPQEMEE